MNLPVLGKGQPWYDVGDKTVAYKIEPDDVIYPDEEPSYGAAQRLTEKIGAAIN
jgi:hypothetical protein